VKCLSKDKLKSQLSEFLVEASNMCSVDHSHVVQLYGIVLGTDSLMLVCTLFTVVPFSAVYVPFIAVSTIVYFYLSFCEVIPGQTYNK